MSATIDETAVAPAHSHTPTGAHDLIVVGASAGGVEALTQLAKGLPSDLPAAVCVVLHVPPTAVSVLPQLLARAGPLPASHAVDHTPLEVGQIYVAPPDRHLIVDHGRLRLTHGPRENRNRPALDPLFRSAARVNGPSVVGVVLTGTLDDGTAGLLAIKRAGGLAIVQDPDDALFAGMPRSALEHVSVDYCLPLTDIAPTLARLAREPAARLPKGASVVSGHSNFDVAMSELERAALENDERPGEPSPFACPECGGVLWERTDGALARYRCRVGHAYSAETLLASQADGYEAALWSALRALEEKAQLTRRLAQRADRQAMQGAATRFRAQLAEVEAHVEALRQLLLHGVSTGAEDVPVASIPRAAALE